jgi:hypothetical protein
MLLLRWKLIAVSAHGVDNALCRDQRLAGRILGRNAVSGASSKRRHPGDESSVLITPFNYDAVSKGSAIDLLDPLDAARNRSSGRSANCPAPIPGDPAPPWCLPRASVSHLLNVKCLIAVDGSRTPTTSERADSSQRLIAFDDGGGRCGTKFENWILAPLVMSGR